jgi:Fur family ferric uptake transcriptional regulator
MATNVASIQAAFARDGLRNTRPRRLIAQRLGERAALGADFTAEELWHELQEVDRHVGRATVFRAVDTLREQGILDRVTFADGTHRYRMCGEQHHHHVTCTECHRVVEVAACLSDAAFSAIAEQTGFALEGHSLDLFGRCRECR